jgi:hypothetical protein
MRKFPWEGVLLAVCLGAVTLALLVHFALIAYYGGVTIQEENPVVLWSEIVMLVAILVFAICQAIKILRR